MVKKIVEIFAVSAVTALCVGLYFRVAGAIPIAVTSTAKQNTFDVTGQGKTSVRPDQAEMTLGVRKESLSIATATEQADATMKELTKELKNLGISEKDMTTSDYSIYPSYGRDGKTADSYTVNTSVRVVIRDITKAGAVVDLAGKLNLEQSGGLMFTLSDDLRDKAVKEARAIAIEKAKKNAEELSGLAGMTLGRIVNIQENGTPRPAPYLMSADLKAGGGNQSTPADIQPGNSDVSVTVTLSYETR